MYITKGPTETTPLGSQIVQGEVWRPVLPTPAPVLMTPPIVQRPLLPTLAHVLRTPPAPSQVNVPQPACPLELPGLSVTSWSTTTSGVPADPFPTIDSLCWDKLLDTLALSLPSPQPSPQPGMTSTLSKGQVIPAKTMVRVPESPEAPREDPGTPLHDEPEGRPVDLQPTFCRRRERPFVYGR